MLQILVVEDNPMDKAYCCSMLSEISPESVVFHAACAEEAIRMMNDHMIDVFFVDVELPRISGYELAGEIRKKLEYAFVHIVFVTADQADRLSIHERYHHYAYIQKPYSGKTFRESVGPLLEKAAAQKRDGQMNPGNTRKNVAQFETTAGQFHFVQTDEILYLRVDKHKIDLITRKKTYPVKSRNLKDLLEEFGVPELCRCHRSFALNVRNVCSIVQETRRLWIANFDENGDICCEISKPFIAEIMKKKER